MMNLAGAKHSMQNSGTKLVVVLLLLALGLGAISWWYRYEASHQASQFWGAEASHLIAESEGFQARHQGVGLAAGEVVPGVPGEVTDLSQARGQTHLRHALMSDRNYDWEALPDRAVTASWPWQLRFYQGDRETTVWLSGDFCWIAKRNPGSAALVARSCVPMADALHQYFQVLGLLARPEAALNTNPE
jgi:hypothetical protein